MARKPIIVTVADVYRTATGKTPHTEAYMGWCERAVHDWHDHLRTAGAKVVDGVFTWCEPDGRRYSYIDWLMQREGVQ